MWGFQYHIRIHGFRDRKRITHAPRFVARSPNMGDNLFTQVGVRKSRATTNDLIGIVEPVWAITGT